MTVGDKRVASARRQRTWQDARALGMPLRVRGTDAIRPTSELGFGLLLAVLLWTLFPACKGGEGEGAGEREEPAVQADAEQGASVDL